jgi:hypothetical protein
MIPCVVLVANICLNNVTALDVNQGGLSGPLMTARGPGYTLVIDPGGDNIRTPDWKRMASACTNKACLAYFKHCKAAGSATVCEYHFSQPGEIQNTVIRLTGDSRKAVTEAETKIGILSRAGIDLEIVPLSALSIESSEDKPPYCRPRAQSSECWPYKG